MAQTSADMSNTEIDEWGDTVSYKPTMREYQTIDPYVQAAVDLRAASNLLATLEKSLPEDPEWNSYSERIGRVKEWSERLFEKPTMKLKNVHQKAGLDGIAYASNCLTDQRGPIGKYYSQLSQLVTDLEQKYLWLSTENDDWPYPLRAIGLQWDDMEATALSIRTWNAANDQKTTRRDSEPWPQFHSPTTDQDGDDAQA